MSNQTQDQSFSMSMDAIILMRCTVAENTKIRRFVTNNYAA